MATVTSGIVYPNSYGMDIGKIIIISLTVIPFMIVLEIKGILGMNLIIIEDKSSSHRIKFGYIIKNNCNH